MSIGEPSCPCMLQGFLMPDTVKFCVDVVNVIEPLVLTDDDILHCIELACSQVVFPC